MAVINWTNVTSFEQLPALANQATGGGFWVGMLFMMFVVLLLILSFWGFETALIVSAFLGFLLALGLVYAGLISWTYTLVFVGIILVMILYIIVGSPKYRE